MEDEWDGVEPTWGMEGTADLFRHYGNLFNLNHQQVFLHPHSVNDQVGNDRTRAYQRIVRQTVPKPLDSVLAPAPLEVDRPTLIFPVQQLGEACNNRTLRRIGISEVLIAKQFTNRRCENTKRSFGIIHHAISLRSETASEIEIA
jgi:hypothetical protein